MSIAWGALAGAFKTSLCLGMFRASGCGCRDGLTGVPTACGLGCADAFAGTPAIGARQLGFADAFPGARTSGALLAGEALPDGRGAAWPEAEGGAMPSGVNTALPDGNRCTFADGRGSALPAGFGVACCPSFICVILPAFEVGISKPAFFGVGTAVTPSRPDTGILGCRVGVAGKPSILRCCAATLRCCEVGASLSESEFVHNDVGFGGDNPERLPVLDADAFGSSNPNAEPLKSGVGAAKEFVGGGAALEPSDRCAAAVGFNVTFRRPSELEAERVGFGDGIAAKVGKADALGAEVPFEPADEGVGFEYGKPATPPEPAADGVGCNVAKFCVLARRQGRLILSSDSRNAEPGPSDAGHGTSGLLGKGACSSWRSSLWAWPAEGDGMSSSTQLTSGASSSSL